MPFPGFGWGMIQTTAFPGSSYGFGEITSTVAGKLTGFSVPNTYNGFRGTRYIPIWQHGLGSAYFNIIINTDNAPIDAEINLINTITSSTYTESKTIDPNDAWIFDTADGALSISGFGWGFITSTGSGTTFAWGAIHATLTGKLIGLTVLIPETGF